MEHIPVIPSGCLPAVLWSANPPQHLRRVGDDLIWLTRADNESTVVWSVPAVDIGRVAPRALASLPVIINEYLMPDGEIERIECTVSRWCLVADDRWIYLDHPDGVARIARSGDEPVVIIAFDREPVPGEWRTITRLALVGGEVFAAGHIIAGDQHCKIVGGFLAQISPGAPTTLWETYVRKYLWIDVWMTSDAESIWLLAENRLYRYRGGAVVELHGQPGPLYGIWSLPSGLFAMVESGALVTVDPETGVVLSNALVGVPGELMSIVEVGGWICVALLEGDHTTILATRRDGRDGRKPRCVARTQGQATELCADDRFLFWSDSAGCICRTPLDRDGAPAAMVIDVPELVGPRRVRPAEPGQPSHTGLPAADRAADEDRSVLYGTVAAVFERSPAPPPDQPILVPWCGWLFLALVRYRVVMLDVIGAFRGGTIRRGRGVVPGTPWTYEADNWLTVSTPREQVAHFRLHDVGDGIHLLIDPDWIHESDFAWHVERRRASCPIAMRLWRWLPAGGLIGRLAGWHVERFGGTRDTERVTNWLRLPDDLERLAAKHRPGDVNLGTERELRRAATWLGDADLVLPADPAWIERLRARHLRMIDELVDLGELAVLEALPGIFAGPALTDACDYLLATLDASRDSYHAAYVTGRVVDVLRAHPDAPPSRVLRRAAAVVTPTCGRKVFEHALLYLCERGIDVGLVRAKLRMLAGLDHLTIGYPDWVPALGVILCALVHEPEAGRAMLQAALTHEDQSVVEGAAGLLIAIAAPWCVTVLRAARSASPHGATIDAALAWLGFDGVRLPPDSRLDDAVELSRWRVEELPHFQQRVLSGRAGDDN